MIPCRGILVLMAIGSMVPGGCKVKNKAGIPTSPHNSLTDSGEQPNDGDPTDDDLVAKATLGTVTFRRTDNGNNGILSITPHQDIRCELRFWPKKKENNDRRQTCRNAGAGSFTESLTDLPGEMLVIEIRFWPADLPKTSSRKTLFSERDQWEIDETLKELIIARTIVPQYRSEIYRHRLETPMKVVDIRQLLTSESGCRRGDPDFPHPFSSAQKPAGIRDLSSAGFASATAVPHGTDEARFIQDYESYDRGTNWDWSLRLDDKDQSFTSNPPGYMDSFSLINEETIRLSTAYRKLVKDGEKIQLKSGSPLSFKWTARHRTSTSRMVIHIKALEKEEQISCSFSAKGSESTVPEDLVDGLPPGEYRLLAVYESHQIFADDVQRSVPWLISSHDWRSAILVKP